MFKGISLLITLLVAGAAQAQDISLGIDRVGPGSHVTMSATSGNVFTHVVLGETGPGEYSYETLDGPALNGQLHFQQVTDASGNLLRRVYPDGQAAQWVPHFCNRTLGTCDFTYIARDGTRSEQQRTTLAFPGGFAFQVVERATGEVISSGHFMIDDYGWAVSTEFRITGQPVEQQERISFNYN